MRSSLRRAYRATNYVVIAPGPEHFVLRAGRHHPLFDAWLRNEQATDAILITAWNPASRQQSVARNIAANKALAAWLEQHGYQYVPTEHRAAHPDWHERGFAVLNMQRQQGITLARRWAQNAILWARPGCRATLLRTRRNLVDESQKFF
jgi:hypothetical protein